MSLFDELEVSSVLTDYDITNSNWVQTRKTKTKEEIYAEFYEKLCKHSAEIKKYFPNLFSYCKSYIFYASQEMFVCNKPYHLRRFILREGHCHISKLNLSLFSIIHGLTITGKYISAVTLCFEYDDTAVEISLVPSTCCARTGTWSLPAELDLLPTIYNEEFGPDYELICLHVGYRDDTIFPQSYEIECFGVITNRDD